MLIFPRLLVAGLLASWLFQATWAKKNRYSINDCNHETVGLVDCRFQGWQSIPYDVFDFPPGKNAIKLGGNPIVCDCRLTWLLRETVVKSRNKKVIQDLYGRLRCASPRRYKGFLLTDLQEYSICRKREYHYKSICREDRRRNLLNCNYMTRLPYDIFKTKMKKISLKRFGYVCDCSIVWFLRKLKQKKYRRRLYDSSDIGYCNSPKRLAKKRLQDVTEEDVCPLLPRKDINPCKVFPRVCKFESILSRCKRDKYSFKCVDINECAENRHDCPFATTDCINMSPNYKCVCKAGFAQRGRGWPCKDIDECAKGRCGKNAKCTNLPGSYECKCNAGFIGKGKVCFDVDECLLNGTCSKDAECVNLPGSYRCTCLSGFRGDGKQCKDIDECKDRRTCSSNAGCFNSPGSYLCQCKQGFTGNGKICTDVNECSTNQHTCHRDAKCINTVPGYQCHCKLGYKSFEDGRLCEDVDECKRKTYCAKQAVCENTPGSFKCVCKIGYSGNGKYCEDKDECEDSKQCSHHAKCKNTDGSYQCTCNAGYYGNGKTCKDVDECSLGNEDICSMANSECVNTPGSYQCKCTKGFKRDASHCSDIDECNDEFPHTCNITELCINYPGGYKCQCKDGYERFSESEPCVKEEVQTLFFERTYVMIAALALAVFVVVLIACCCCCCCCAKCCGQKESASSKKSDESIEPLLYGTEMPYMPMEMPPVPPNVSMFSTYSEKQDFDYYDVADIK